MVEPTAADVDGAPIVTDVSTAAAFTVIVTFAVTVTAPDVALAVMTDVPAETPVTSPVALTVALAGVPELHVTVAAMALPNWSFGLAVSWVVLPAVMVVGVPEIATEVRTGG